MCRAVEEARPSLTAAVVAPRSTARVEVVYRATRRLPPFAVPILVAIAIFGYLVGHRHVPTAAGETTRITSRASILLEYPSSWQQTAADVPIPGLSIGHPLLLAPGGDATHAGLLGGALSAGGPSPLPARFLALMHGMPHVEVVDLLDGQAYRYSRLSLPGYGRVLDLYVVPNAGESPTALACYASQAFSAQLARCEQIVAKLTLIGQSSTYDLTPDTAYAGRLGALIDGLNRERLTLRREMRLEATPAAVGNLATTLAGRFAAVATSLAVLEPPLAAGSAQAALAGAILRARDAYIALAAAAAAGSPARFLAARGEVDEAEASIDAALEGLALLGYRA
jgi:hypothetical protein